jgi:magnesium transporter
VALIFQGDWKLGLVIGLALVINHTLACTSGGIIPFIMKWLGFDPAQSATIIATTVTDVAGFFSLLGLARILLG